MNVRAFAAQTGIFGEAVGDVAHEHGEVLEAALKAGAITGVESAV